MKPITQEMLREIVPDFAQAIREKKTKTAKSLFDLSPMYAGLFVSEWDQ